MVTIATFGDDEQGRSYADVLSDRIATLALERALAVMNDPVGLGRMKDSVDRHLNPPLVGVIKEIEALPEFVRATQLSRKKFDRLKMAIGVGCKLTMAKLGYDPQNLPSGKPDQARLDRYSRWFTTARRYRKR